MFSKKIIYYHFQNNTSNKNVYLYLLLSTSAVLAKKVLEDLVSDNSYYCQIGLFTEKELNLAEYSLFSRLNYEVNYIMEDLEQVYNQIFTSLSNQRKTEFLKI